MVIVLEPYTDLEKRGHHSWECMTETLYEEFSIQPIHLQIMRTCITSPNKKIVMSKYKLPRQNEHPHYTAGWFTPNYLSFITE